MSCGKDAAHCKQIAGASGAPEAMAVWAEGRGAGGHCPDCGGFLTTEGVCNNPHTFSMSLAGGTILGVVDTTDTVGVCPDCGATLSVAPGEEDWCMECEELVTSPLPGTIEALRQLKDDHPYIRQSAAEALGAIGDPAAIPALEKALKGDDDPTVCGYAAKALGKIGDPAAIPVLIEALKGDDGSYVRRNVAEALGAIGSPAVPALENALKDKTPSVRGDAVWALGKIGDKAAIPALAKALGDDDPYVREAAKKALWTTEDEGKIAVVTYSLQHETWANRKQAIKSLKNLTDPAMIVPILTEIVIHDKSKKVKQSAINKLSELGEIAALAVPALEKALGNKDSYQMRWEAAEALGKIGDPAAIPALAKALNEDKNSGVRRNAAWALREIKGVSK